ncbi:MAG: hypothetical protein ACRD2J_11185 [Thermoanaerobaculia bacterium]
MHAIPRGRVMVLLLLVPALTQIAGAANQTVGRPLPPGTTVHLIAPQNPEAGSKVPVKAQLDVPGGVASGGEKIQFRVLEGKATLDQPEAVTNGSGTAGNALAVASPGKIVLEATCRAKDCRAVVTLNAVPAQ